jgi:glycosyltransferase involved in cell wall biosynthesis
MTTHSSLVIWELSPDLFHSLSRGADTLKAESSPTVMQLYTCLCESPDSAETPDERVLFRHAQAGDSLLEFAHAILLEQPLAAEAFIIVQHGVSLNAIACAELLDVIALHEKHAIVVPRSNVANIGILPRSLPTGEASHNGHSQEFTAGIFETTSVLDDRFRVAPFAEGGVAAIRTAQFLNYFLDVGKRVGDRVSLRDYSIFINEMGYSSVLANRALSLSSMFQTNFEAAAPAREWDAYIAHVFNNWRQNDTGPIENFAGLLSPAKQRSRVLIDASALPEIINGTSRNTTTFLAKLNSELGSGQIDWDVTILVPEGAIPTLSRSFGYLSFLGTGELQNQIFELGLCLTPVTTSEELLRLNRSCLRWVILHLDIIALRSLPFLSQNVSAKSVVHGALQFADSVIFISRSSAEDVAAFFPGVAKHVAEVGSVILQGALALSTKSEDVEAAPEPSISQLQPGYILIMGNSHPHKQVTRTQVALAELGLPIVSFGGQPSSSSRILAIPSGKISDQGMVSLVKNASVVVFPSAYEGFGLPLADISLAGKTCVLFDTEVAREISIAMNLQGRAFFFTSFSELQNQVLAALAAPEQPSQPVRTHEDFNGDVIGLLSHTLSLEPNAENLRRRWFFFQALENLSQSLVAQELGRGKNVNFIEKVWRRIRS